MDKTNLTKRVILALVGTLIIAVSIGMVRFTDLGLNPFTAMLVGFTNLSHIEFRYIYPLVNALLIIAVLLIDKSMIGIGTILNLFLIGPVADYSLLTMENITTNPSYGFRLFILLIGILIMSLGISLYTSANVGNSAYDSVFLIINEKKPKISKGQARLITDAICVIISVFGKATLGIGTILNVLLTGPLIDVFNKYLIKKIY